MVLFSGFHPVAGPTNHLFLTGKAKMQPEISKVLRVQTWKTKPTLLESALLATSCYDQNYEIIYSGRANRIGSFMKDR